MSAHDSVGDPPFLASSGRSNAQGVTSRSLGNGGNSPTERSWGSNVSERRGHSCGVPGSCATSCLPGSPTAVFHLLLSLSFDITRLSPTLGPWGPLRFVESPPRKTQCFGEKWRVMAPNGGTFLSSDLASMKFLWDARGLTERKWALEGPSHMLVLHLCPRVCS